MKRKFYIVLLLALAPTLASALGLGNLDLNSALNEPFDARIQLLSPTADELDSLNIGLADSEAFARAKIDRPFILSKLKFALRRSPDDGPDYIRVFSQEPIREPFLNFLVEVTWSNGRLFREYTVLLDPPLYDPNARASEFTQAKPKVEPVQPTAEVAAPSGEDNADNKVIYWDDTDSKQTSSSTAAPAINYSAGDYGPTDASDTLWSVASKMRPDTSISVNQMMAALLRANPEAFVNQNINGLKRGQILRMPNENEITALNNAQALAEVQSQHAAWNDIKNNLSSVTAERPEVSSVPEPTTTPEEVSTEASVETDPELKLVSADDANEANEQVASSDSGAGNDLILAQESIQALTQENLELNDKLQESEALLNDLKRLLSLKDDELAALQEQMAADAEVEGAVEEAEVVEEDAVEETAMEEPVADVVEDDVAVVDEEEIDVVEEETIDVIETEPAADSGGIMGMVEQYLGPVKELLLGNPIIGMAVGGVLLVLIIIIVLMKFRKEPAETVNLDSMTEEAFPDFDSGDIGDTGAEVDDSEEDDSEAVTVLPDSEAETAVHEPVADLELDAEEEEKTEFAPAEESVEEEPEEEPEEDPLQEVNTYLAFEQFDQAEEFVRNVIAGDPDNPEFHTKLLEVFYTSGNKKSYEEAAKVLHEKVGGEGEHWNIAVAMWQEMSPSRALFEEGDDGDDNDDADNTGGFVDVTADEESADDSNGLDFDIGGADDVPAAAEPASEEMLDITASDEGEDMLDVTAAVGLDADDSSVGDSSEDDMLDISGSSLDSDEMLDVTGESADSDEMLDVTGESVDSDEMLDITGESADSDEMLDLTGGSADSDEMLDVTGESADSDEMLDVTGESADSDEMLDLTGGSADSDEVLDVTGSSADSDDMLDLTSSSADSDEMLELSASGSDDLLDISSGEDASGEGLLDVTAVSDLDLDSEEDLLDVTAATSAGADSSELLGLNIEPESDGLNIDDDDNETVELNISDSAVEDDSSSTDDNVLDFDLGTDGESNELEIGASEAEDPGLELEIPDLESTDTAQDNSLEIDLNVPGSESEALDLSLDVPDDDTPIRLDVDETPEDKSDDEISLDFDMGSDDDLELDLSADTADETPDFELELDTADESTEAEGDVDMSFDLTLDESPDDAAGLDLDGTVEIPKSVSLDVDDDDDDDDDEHTVFVPRAAQPEEQSAEDEIATKLDLAKAYVELGDKDSAKAILDEVMAEGNDEQRQQAQDLLG